MDSLAPALRAGIRRYTSAVLVGLAVQPLLSNAVIARVTSVSGSAVIIQASSANPRNFTNDGDITGYSTWVLEEQEQPAQTLPVNVRIHARAPGCYDDNNDLLPPGTVVPAGTKVDSHYIYARKPGADVAHDATIEFDGRILGVICDTPALTGGSNFLGLPAHVVYPPNNTDGLGLEPNAAHEDRFCIAANRHSLTVHLMCGHPGDRMRVLTAHRDSALPADLNCDNVVNFLDIDPLLLALFDPVAYESAYPNCDVLNGDINGDELLNFLDIDPFVACLFATCP